MREELLGCGISIRPMTAGGSQPVVRVMSAAWSVFRSLWRETNRPRIFSRICFEHRRLLGRTAVRRLAAQTRRFRPRDHLRQTGTGLSDRVEQLPTMDKRMDAR